MADDENAQENVAKARVLPITHVTTETDFTSRVAIQEKVTAVFFMSSDCPVCVKDGLAAFENLASEAEFEPTLSFVQVDLNQAEHHVAHRAHVHALPDYQFYFDGQLIERFSGNNADKVKLMAKNAVLRRVEILTVREEEARAAAAAAAATPNPAE